MRRRRKGRWQDGESFGTSLADILTSALGCVLLLFMVAVMHVRTSLADAQAKTLQAIEDLAAREQARKEADQLRALEASERAAAERRLAMEALARDEAIGALTTAEEKILALQARVNAAEAAAAAALEAQQAAERDRIQIRTAASTTLAELDPRTARPVDVMLVIDGTRSMDESLDATRQNLNSTLKALRVVSPTARVGVVVFRDKRERADLRLQRHPLTADAASLRSFLEGIEATSTGRDRDMPEWLCGGIADAAGAKWRDEAIKLMIVVSDAGAQSPKAKACIKSVQSFRAEGGQVHMLSMRPPGYEDSTAVQGLYEGRVIPEHSAIAAAGGGLHIRDAQSDALLTEVLQAAFRSRTRAPIDRLRKALEDAQDTTP
ncbi:MAG: vWA domain-containing protein [Bradymonadia bacterium]